MQQNKIAVYNPVGSKNCFFSIVEKYNFEDVRNTTFFNQKTAQFRHPNQVLYTNGIIQSNILTTYKRPLGMKRFELSNHLGNVLVSVTDKKVYKGTAGNIYFEAEITSITAPIKNCVNFFLKIYTHSKSGYPFGSAMQTRSYSSGAYRFGFNNQEKDAELGDCYAFEPTEGSSRMPLKINIKNHEQYRIHDARLGRFLSVDPLHKEYPWNSNYAFAENNIIACIDLEGLEKYYSAAGIYLGQVGTDAKIRIVDADHMLTSTTEELKKYVIEANEFAKKNPNKLNGYSDAIWFGSHDYTKFINGLGVSVITFMSWNKSKTFKKLAQDCNAVSISLNNSNKQTYTTGDNRIIVYGKDDKSKLLGLVWELTNSSNIKRLNNIRNNIDNITEKEYVMGILKIEAEADFNKTQVAYELKMDIGFDPLFGDYLLKKITKEQYYAKKAESLYKYAKVDGTDILMRDKYGEQYKNAKAAKAAKAAAKKPKK